MQAESALWEMYRQERSGGLRREDFAMNALEKALLWFDAINPRMEKARLAPGIIRASEYLRENPDKSFSINDIAEVVGLSSSRFSHLFREQTGMTPGQFLERERIMRANQLLTVTSRTIAEISAMVGFASPFYFTSRFRKITGVNPREFRRLL